MQGLHLIGDLHDCRCNPALLLDAPRLEHFCSEACQAHGLTVVGQLFHAFAAPAGGAGGVTGTVVLAESHLAIHTWPELSAVTLDLYVCNFSADNTGRARSLFHEVVAAFLPARPSCIEVRRGEIAPRT